MTEIDRVSFLATICSRDTQQVCVHFIKQLILGRGVRNTHISVKKKSWSDLRIFPESDSAQFNYRKSQKKRKSHDGPSSGSDVGLNYSVYREMEC